MKKLLRSLSFAVPAVALLGSAQAGAQTKVLFEAMHAQTAGNADWVLDEDSCGVAQRFPTPAQSGITASTAETYWNGGFSAFGVALVKKGFSVESLPTGSRITYGDSSNAQDLKNYKVFILPEPNTRYTAAERSAIQAFVKGGGGLFLISDHAGSDRNNDGDDSPTILNDLMTGVSWGLHFQLSSETNSWFDDHPDANYTKDTTSPIIFTGPYGKPAAGRGLGLYGSTTLTLSTSSNPNVKGHIWMASGTSGSSTQVTFATATDGLGRIAAITDSSPAEDVTNSCGHTTNNGWGDSATDNALIHLNAVAWLAGAGGGSSDTTAPSAPSSLSASAASASQVGLTWGASTDDVGVTSYNIYRGLTSTSFSAVASTSTPGFTDSGLAASTTYYYRVTADDAAGNESAVSNTASATTAAGGGTGGTAQVIINEILANEPGSDTTQEFIELVNVGSAAADLSGWSLWDSSAKVHTFPSGTSIAAGKVLTVFGAASGIPSGTPNAVGSSTGSLGLGNSGDTVTVKNASGSTVNTFTYTSALSGTDGVSMTRSPDSSASGTFVLHTSVSALSFSPSKHSNGSAF